MKAAHRQPFSILKRTRPRTSAWCCKAFTCSSQRPKTNAISRKIILLSTLSRTCLWCANNLTLSCHWSRAAACACRVKRFRARFAILFARACALAFAYQPQKADAIPVWNHRFAALLPFARPFRSLSCASFHIINASATVASWLWHSTSTKPSDWILLALR